MDKNVKALSFFSLLVLAVGLFLLWFGLKEPLDGVVSAPSSQNEKGLQEANTSESAAIGIEGERVLVTKVVDGDTIEIEGGKRVRYLGVDTPETKDPRRPVQCFGKEASNENKFLVEGKVVILQKDISETDKYNRLLRYVYLPLEDSRALFINDYLIREGFAKALTYPPDVKFSERFLEAEREAKMNKEGLWGRC